MKTTVKEKLKNLIEKYSNIIRSNPEDYNALNKRGVYEFYLQDYEGELKDYRKAVEINPKFVKVFTKIRLKIYFNVKNVKKSLNFGNYFCF